jgi:hypothetical protein
MQLVHPRSMGENEHLENLIVTPIATVWHKLSWYPELLQSLDNCIKDDGNLLACFLTF